MSDEPQREMTLHEIMTKVGEQHSAYKEYNQLVYELDKAKHDRDKGYERADREAALAVKLRNAMDDLVNACENLVTELEAHAIHAPARLALAESAIVEAKKL